MRLKFSTETNINPLIAILIIQKYPKRVENKKDIK